MEDEQTPHFLPATENKQSFLSSGLVQGVGVGGELEGSSVIAGSVLVICT